MQNASAAAAVAVIVVVPVAVAVAILPPPLLQEISALSQTTFRCRFPLVENIYIFAAILCVMHRERFLFLSFFLSSTIIYRAIYKSWRRVFLCTSFPFFLFFFFYHGKGESTREIHAAEKRTRATQGSEERERRRGVSVRRLAYPAKLCIFRRTKRNETKRNGTRRVLRSITRNREFPNEGDGTAANFSPNFPPSIHRVIVIVTIIIIIIIIIIITSLRKSLFSRATHTHIHIHALSLSSRSLSKIFASLQTRGKNRK